VLEEPPPHPPNEKNGFHKPNPPEPLNEPAAGVAGRCSDKNELAILLNPPPAKFAEVVPAPLAPPVVTTLVIGID
jgi:hypothetical protein